MSSKRKADENCSPNKQLSVKRMCLNASSQKPEAVIIPTKCSK